MTNALSPQRVRRYRVLFWCFLLTPILAVVAGGMSGRYLDDLSPVTWVLAVVFLVALCGGLLGLVLLQMRVLHVVDPEPRLRSEILRDSWFGVIGNILAIERLLQEASREHQRRLPGHSIHPHH